MARASGHGWVQPRSHTKDLEQGWQTPSVKGQIIDVFGLQVTGFPLQGSPPPPSAKSTTNNLRTEECGCVPGNVDGNLNYV